MIIQGAHKRLNGYNVQWQLGNFCNYKCSYCAPLFRDGSLPFAPIDIAKRVVTNVIKKSNGRNCTFNFQGGEITTYREFRELLMFVYESGAHSLMVSNASRSPAYFATIAPYLHFIYFTFHSDQTKIAKFLNVLKVFHPKNLLVYLPMNPAKWDICIDAYDQITNLGYAVVPKVLYEDYGGGHANIEFPYTPEQKQFIDEGNQRLMKVAYKEPDWEVVQSLPYNRKGTIDTSLKSRVIQVFDKGTEVRTTSQNLIINDLNRYKGFMCSGGLEMLCITARGKVFTSVCMQDRAIANIYENPEFDLPTEAMYCRKDKCWCDADLVLSKVSPDEPTFKAKSGQVIIPIVSR